MILSARLGPGAGHGVNNVLNGARPTQEAALGSPLSGSRRGPVQRAPRRRFARVVRLLTPGLGRCHAPGAARHNPAARRGVADGDPA